MSKRFRKIVFSLFVFMCVPQILGYSVSAEDTLVVRTVDDYGIDFTQMSLADYCIFFVQDINLKYGKGMHCTGDGRSSGITNYNSLHEVCINELNGGDNGLDCSSLVYLIGKFFGSKAVATTTAEWSNSVIGTHISAKINAKTEGFDDLEIGDVIVTMDGGQGHALICVGEIDGENSMIHIGSSHMCNGSEPVSCTCCTIRPGEGVDFCSDCVPNITNGSNQNKRFIRTASVSTYFRDVGSFDSCFIYRPIYERQVGAEYSGTNYGSGAQASTIITWVHRTGTLTEEAEIFGMPGRYEFDGEPVVILGRDGLGMSERVALTTIGTGIGYSKWSIESISSVVVVAVGMLLMLYAFLLILGYIFDLSNNFIDISVISILTFGKWVAVDDQDVKKTIKKNGKVYITKVGVVVRSLIVGLIGALFVSGLMLDFIAWVLNKIMTGVGNCL